MSAPYGGQHDKYPPYDNYGNPPPYNPNPQNQGYPPQGYPPQGQGYPPQSQGYPQTQGYYPQNYGQDGYQSNQHQPQPPPPPTAALSGLRNFTPDDIMEEDINRFSDKTIRRAFIRKVYLIVTGQLLFTLVFVILFSSYRPIKDFLNKFSWVYYIAYGVFLVTYLVLVCVKSVRRKVPLNYICLFIFTSAFTYMTAAIAGYYNTFIVLIAIAITAAVCIGITIFAMQTRFDFTMCSGLLFVISLVVLLFGIAVALTFAFAKLDQRTAMILQCVYASVCALLFSMYLVFDTQMLMGNKKNSISEEEYIYAALQLYLDMVQIFIALLQIVGAVSK